MKAATGEVNLTVITIVAIGLVAAGFYLIWTEVIEPDLRDNWKSDTSYIEVVESDLI